MEDNIVYPTAEKIIEYNLFALEFFRAKKADKAKVLSRSHILDIINDCNETEGDIYDKAVVLLFGLVKKHPFASGNRRTAFVVTKYFLMHNNAKFAIKDDPGYAKIMLGIRENHYTKEEVKEWIQNGKIREFKR